MLFAVDSVILALKLVNGEKILKLAHQVFYEYSILAHDV